MEHKSHSAAPVRDRTMTREEADLAVAWAATKGWNPGLHDAACFHQADPEGYLIAEAHGHQSYG